MYRYGLYTRKSDDDQSVTEKSIGEQLAECRTLIERENLIVIKTWEESKSAKIPRVRPNWAELVAMVEQDDIDAILCWHINRLVRNMEEGGRLVQLFVEGRIREIRTPHALYRTGDNILPLVIEAAAATQYSLDLSHAVRRGLQKNFENGNCNSRAPQGYRNARSPVNLKQGTVEADPERFHLIREAWELMLVGSYSVIQVVDHLNGVRHYTTRLTRKRGGTPLSKAAAYDMFRNPFYMGMIRYKRRVVPGHHQAMVTPDEFARVQQLMQKASFAVSSRPDFAFTGLMRCTHCGFQITAERKRLRDGQLWSNYRCSDSKLQCTKRGISGPTVEQKIASELEQLKIDRDFGEIALADIRRALVQRATEDSRAIGEAEAQLRKSDERLRNLEELAVSGAIRASRYQELEDAELTRRQELLAERERLRSENERMMANAERAVRFATFAPQQFRKQLPARQKEIARTLAREYRFDGIQKTITITVLSLLSEVVTFVKEGQRSIEPPNEGSGKQKELAFASSICFGGPCRHEIEVPEPLLRELKGPLFPEFLWLLEGETEEVA